MYVAVTAGAWGGGGLFSHAFTAITREFLFSLVVEGSAETPETDTAQCTVVPVSV